MTLATIFRILQLVLFFAVLYPMLLSAENHPVMLGISTLIYIISLLLISYARIGQVRPLVIYFVILSTFWCVNRLVFLNASVESINYQYLVDFNPGAMAISVMMLTLSSIALVTGMAFAASIRAPRVRVQVPIVHAAVNLRFFAAYFLLLLVWLLFENSIFRTGAGNKLLAIMGMALSLDTMVLLATALCVYRSDMTPKLRLLMYLLLLTYVIFRALAGSKNGIYMITTGALVALLAFNYHYRFNLRQIITAALVVAAALILFVFGTATRSLSVVMTSSGSFAYGELISGLLESYSEIMASFDARQWIEAVSKRLSMYDYLHVMFSGDPVTSHLGLVYGFKSLWNVVTPPIVAFNEASLFQANLFKVAYGHGTFGEAAVNYHTDMLPLFGAFYVNFGFFWLIPIALFGYVSARIFIYINCLRVRERWFFSALSIYFFGDFLFGMGVVSTIQQILFFTVPPLMTYFIVQRFRLGILHR